MQEACPYIQNRTNTLRFAYKTCGACLCNRNACILFALFIITSVAKKCYCQGGIRGRNRGLLSHFEIR